MQDSQQDQNRFTPDPFWNYHPPLPLQLSPYVSTKKRLSAIATHFIKTWHPLGMPFWFLLIAVVVWNFFTPALSRAAEFRLDWIFEIWLRDMILILVIAGGTHLFLYTFNRQGDELKFDKRGLEKSSSRFTFRNQTWDNMFWTLTSGVACWVFWESLLLWGFANGYASLISLENNPVLFIALLAVIPVWTYLYFDFQHRILHTKWLYKHVHSWHHRNNNTGPWSGLAMHPVEQFILMSDTLIFFIVSSHPIHVIYDLIFHGLGAPMSHTGFERMKLGKRIQLRVGDFYHQLHHRFVDTNHGTLDTPFDKWYGTFHDGTLEATRELRKSRTSKRSG